MPRERLDDVRGVEGELPVTLRVAKVYYAKNKYNTPSLGVGVLTMFRASHRVLILLYGPMVHCDKHERAVDNNQIINTRNSPGGLAVERLVHVTERMPPSPPKGSTPPVSHSASSTAGSRASQYACACACMSSLKRAARSNS